MSVDELLQSKRQQILQTAARHGAHNVRLFGSAAQGEATSESDVDLLVDVEAEHSAWFPAGLVAELEKLLGCEVDVVTEDALHWYIRDRVLEAAVPL